MIQTPFVFGKKKRKRFSAASLEKRKNARKEKEDEIKTLNDRIKAEAPGKGVNPLLAVISSGDQTVTFATTFDQLPLSRPTKQGLEEAEFTKMTSIQRAAIPHALAGRDILGAAKTGSGKTLAFLIPVLETLYRDEWGPEDGIGALIISPTRELALQTFEVLRKIGPHHSFSAGLVIGGKDVKEEQERIGKMNILIATPGRILHHMDQTQDFDCSTLKILVLDEADRLLDMGFEKTINAILENLPSHRQTLLFSATQTNSLTALSRLSLHEPEYLGVHDNAKQATPSRLTQTITIIKLEEKVNFLYAFMRAHLMNKCIIFFSCCKQVRFFYQVFSSINLGAPVMELHGKMKQMKRLAVFTDFGEQTGGVFLLATDIAARGLDIPGVEWVIQLDCPEDPETYIHRAGRTARYQSSGKSIMVLLPSEIEMIQRLKEKKIDVNVMRPARSKLVRFSDQLPSMIAGNPQLKYFAQKALINYVRSVYINKDKTIFKYEELPLAKFAKSLGLSGIPHLKFVPNQKEKKNSVRVPKEDKLMIEEEEEEEEKEARLGDEDDEENDKDEEEEEEEEDEGLNSEEEEALFERKAKKSRNATERLFKRKNKAIERQFKLLDIPEENQNDEDDLLVVKNKHEPSQPKQPLPPHSELGPSALSEQELAELQNLREQHMNKVKASIAAVAAEDKRKAKELRQQMVEEKEKAEMERFLQETKERDEMYSKYENDDNENEEETLEPPVLNQKASWSKNNPPSEAYTPKKTRRRQF